MKHLRASTLLIALISSAACTTSNRSAPATDSEPASERVAAEQPVASPAGPAPTQPISSTPPQPPPLIDARDLPELDSSSDQAAAARAQPLNVAGLGFLKKGDYAAAIAAFATALQTDPGHILARYNMACAYALAGSPDNAMILLEQLAAEECPVCRKSLAKALSDPDLASLRDDNRFTMITVVVPATGPMIAARFAPNVDWSNTRVVTRLPALSADGTRLAYSLDSGGWSGIDERTYVIYDLTKKRVVGEHLLGLLDWAPEVVGAAAIRTRFNQAVDRALAFLGEGWQPLVTRGTKHNNNRYELGAISVALNNGTMSVEREGKRLHSEPVREIAAANYAVLTGVWASADDTLIVACVRFHEGHVPDRELCRAIRLAK